MSSSRSKRSNDIDADTLTNRGSRKPKMSDHKELNTGEIDLDKFDIRVNTRKKVFCICKKCSEHDGKWIDPRTKKNHMQLEEIPKEQVTTKMSSLQESECSVQSNDIGKDNTNNKILKVNDEEKPSGLYMNEEEEDNLPSSRESSYRREFTPPDVPEISLVPLNEINADDFMTVWIFKYQQRFNLPNTAIDVLIKVLGIYNDVSQFPSSIHMAKSGLNLKNPSFFRTFIACSNCHTLYSETIINNAKIENRIPTCNHIEFPRQQTVRGRGDCHNELAKSI